MFTRLEHLGRCKGHLQTHAGQTVAIKYSALVCALMFKTESEVYIQLQSHPDPVLQMKKVGASYCVVLEHAVMDLAQSMSATAPNLLWADYHEHICYA